MRKESVQAFLGVQLLCRLYQRTLGLHCKFRLHAPKSIGACHEYPSAKRDIASWLDALLAYVYSLETHPPTHGQKERQWENSPER